jgi:rod shape-determining protein MreC
MPDDSVSGAAGSSADAIESPVRGVAEGHLRDGLVLNLLPAGAVIEEGDLVVTSGLGGNYPRSLLLGSVTAIDERPQAPFMTARVEPAADLSNLDTVLVLISFKPARLTGP